MRNAVVSAVLYDPVGNDLHGERVDLLNVSNDPINLADWTLSDAAGAVFTFGPVDLLPGASISVYTGQGRDTPSTLYWNRRRAVWNNRGGDLATLRDAAGGVVSRLAYTRPVDAPGLSGNDDLARRFAPEVRLHPTDKFRPSSVPWLLGRVSLRFGMIIGVSPVVVKPAGSVSPHNLTTAKISGVSSAGGRRSAYFLQIEDEKTREGDLSSSQCYVNVVDRSDLGEGVVEYQYWMYYPYSGNITSWPLHLAHEGDWEHVTVRARDDQLIGVFTSAHSPAEGRWHGPGRLRFSSGHPVVFSARHSHAHYVRPGEHVRPGALPNDYTLEGGPRWETWTELQVLVDQPWFLYNGAWGPRGDHAFTSGPYGPQYSNSWPGEPKGPPGNICFYEGDNLSGDILGWTSDKAGQRLDLTRAIGWANDEIRSLSLFGGDCSGRCGDPDVSAGEFGEDVEGSAAVLGRGR
jgi:hypothetical protein